MTPPSGKEGNAEGRWLKVMEDWIAVEMRKINTLREQMVYDAVLTLVAQDGEHGVSTPRTPIAVHSQWSAASCLAERFELQLVGV